MKLVIDIPEAIYNHTQEYEVGGFNQENDTKLLWQSRMVNRFQRGTEG